jgi:hypothetical protein
METYYADLQAVSIDPGKPSIKVGEKTFIEVVMKNNGPHSIPKGEATCQVTVNNKCLSVPYKTGFTSHRWSLVAVKRSKGHVNLFFKTSGEMGIGSTSFRFNVTGKAVGKSDVTLASSLSGNATGSDIDGNNQSVSTEVIINPKRKYRV